LSQRLSVIKTQDFQSLLLEIPGPLGVVFCLSELQMLSSVEFDDQFCCRCIKISDTQARPSWPARSHRRAIACKPMIRQDGRPA